MLGHYLGTLTVEQEDRVLTVPFGPIYGPGYLYASYSGCLMCAVTGTESWNRGCLIETDEDGRPHDNRREPGFLYEKLCARFGAPRVNAAIRNRILSNRARRVLTHEVGSVGAVPGRPQ